MSRGIMGARPGQQAVRAFLEGYGRALAAGDVEAIAACWEVPALVLSDEGARAVAEPSEIERFFDAAIGWYRERGLATSEPHWIETEPLGERMVSADVTWAALDENGVLRAAEHSRYLLRVDDAGELRIRVAVTTGPAEDALA